MGGVGEEGGLCVNSEVFSPSLINALEETWVISSGYGYSSCRSTATQPYICHRCFISYILWCHGEHHSTCTMTALCSFSMSNFPLILFHQCTTLIRRTRPSVCFYCNIRAQGKMLSQDQARIGTQSPCWEKNSSQWIALCAQNNTSHREWMALSWSMHVPLNTTYLNHIF